MKKDVVCEICGFRIKRFGSHANRVRDISKKRPTYYWVHTACLKAMPPYSAMQQ